MQLFYFYDRFFWERKLRDINWSGESENLRSIL